MKLLSSRLALLSTVVLAFWGSDALAQSAIVRGNRVTVTDGANKVDVDQSKGNHVTATDGANKVDVDQSKGNHVTATDGANRVEVDNGRGSRVKITTGAGQANTRPGSVDVKANAREHEPRRAPARALEPLTIVGNDEKVEEDCAGRDVEVSGNSLKVKLRGECGRVEVSGNDNGVDIDAVARIEVIGSANRVTWVTAPGAARPRISKTGSDNEVTRRSR